jgi:hypothetical protein
MTDRQPRAREQRRADTLAKLSAPAADVWVATAAVDNGGRVSSYLVPLSLAWIDERVVLATEADSATARNIISHGRARLGLGPTRDVVMIDAELEQVAACLGSPRAGCQAGSVMVPLPTIVAWPPTMTSVIRPSCLCAVPSRALGRPMAMPWSI